MGTARKQADIGPLPWVGYTGFRWHDSVTPPVTWLREHYMAEAGGWFREGRKWRPPNMVLCPTITKQMPTAQLYAPMIDRISLAGAAAMGYTIDS